MKEVQFGVITFKSTQYAIQADAVLKKEKMRYRTIPTPREISHSCGLAIKFHLEDYDNIKHIIENNSIVTEGIFRIIKSPQGSRVEKLH